MNETVLLSLKKYGIDLRHKSVLTALSGGADSTALLCVLCSLSKDMDFRLCAAHINHHLRGADADADEEFCRRLCAQKGVELYVSSLDIAGIAKRERKSTELAAREARYAFFDEISAQEGIDYIATAHTASDNLETMLFNLVRGTGGRGMCGIPPVRGKIIRPLIHVTRDEVEEYLASEGQEYVTDKTNFENDYSRNKIRNLVIPYLKEINPAVERNASRTAEWLRGDCDFLDGAASHAVKDCGGSISASELLALPRPIASRAVVQAFYRAGGEELSGRNVDDIMGICSSSRGSELSLPGGMRCKLSFGKLTFSKADRGKSPDFDMELGIFEGKSVIITPSGYRIEAFVRENDKKKPVHKKLMTAHIDYDKISWPIQIRSRREGDKYRPLGSPGRKTIKKMMIEKKIDADERHKLPVFISDGEIFYCAGLDISDEKKINSQTKRILTIEVAKNEK